MATRMLRWAALRMLSLTRLTKLPLLVLLSILTACHNTGTMSPPARRRRLLLRGGPARVALS